ncbi:MAG: transposase, partial [Phycisphaerales bacterium]|nr:transposase [Phycisphaerales bacterium]
MPRPRRRFRARCAYHVTVRCNNRAFDLRSREARAVVLDALRRSLPKHTARLYGVALMSNHVH